MAHKLDHGPLKVKPGKKVRLGEFDPGFTAGISGKKAGKAALLEDVTALAEAQSLLWANARYSLLVILQALDAAGKDGAIKHVMSGVNPQGVDVHAFKAPNEEERLHHFMWRPMQKLPARGRIAVFNRSYYEEVLVVRVHPTFLDQQVIPSRIAGKALDEVWKARYDDINRMEAFWTSNDVRIVKFFLNVSRDEQKQRFLERLENPDKNWKFSAADLRERGYWDEYHKAYEDMLEATSTDHAPWYVIPADHKWFARAAIADIIVRHINDLKLEPPQLSKADRIELAKARVELENE